MAVVSLLGFAIPVKSQAPIDSDLTSKEGIQSYIALEASKQGVDASLVEKIVECESQYKVGAVGDHGAALGLAQFHKETFYRMQSLFNENPMYTYGDERTELRLLIDAVKTGHDEWTCW